MPGFTRESSRPATLVLEDGTKYQGFHFGAAKSVAGEAVFQTGMVGYNESLSDPSYRGQLLTLTFPLIGNYGVPSKKNVDEYGLSAFFESTRVQPAALIIDDYSFIHSHWNAEKSLHDLLDEEGVTGIYGIDTRALTKKLRSTGSLLGKIVVDNKDVDFKDPNKVNLVAEVSTKTPIEYGRGDKRILVVDCGVKYNQIRCFLKRGVSVKVVPWDHDFTNESYDGLFISNGPGDPTMAGVTIENIRKALANFKPIFGICLGHQLLSLAAGAKTYKLKFGNRGHNQPCTDQLTNKCQITMQNHGFAVDAKTLPEDWQEFFVNANDGTNEGIIHKNRPIFSVQFHPEAKGGPEDTEYLFDMFVKAVRGDDSALRQQVKKPKHGQVLLPRKVLVLGSGGLTIGQAGEFDYSGSQCIKALREHNVKTVLINPNIATVQTSKGLADKVYFLPVTPDYVAKVIADEKCDGIMLSFGGQTALNCGVKLYNAGTLKKLGCRVLGTPVESIIATEDREIFSTKLNEIGQKIARSEACASIDECIKAANEIGYPVIARAAFALGGLGSGFADNDDELRELARKAFSASPQVLVERSMKGWKEVEYEVVRDINDNCITVCNMENFDPLGIHTGESIVVAPSQTLSDDEYHMLRTAAINTIRHLGVVGECNIQYALNPYSKEYCVIEVNARLSRSSALASKATGYPLAFVAAKLGLGLPLTDIQNTVTQKTCACFEPSLDYCVVKMPRWDLKKFDRVSTKLGSAMKSVGEVMSIGRTFEEAFQKALRMVDFGNEGFEPNSGFKPTVSLESEIANATDMRVWALAAGFQEGMTVEQMHKLSHIDNWFLNKLKYIHDLRLTMSKSNISNLDKDLLKEAKRRGFSDRQIATCVNSDQYIVRKKRKQLGIVPVVKQIDTVAAEFPAMTNYLYVTYDGVESDVSFAESGGVAVIGSGVYRIGSSVEFDWCAVSSIRSLRALGHRTIMINYNPETVSTDYDESDRLYFEELSTERVLDIYDLENPLGVVVSVGGQIPNNLSMPLHRQNVKILGTSAEMIDSAENRYKFSRLLDQMGVDQPQWKELVDITSAKAFCNEVSYPCLVRPSYVLSGAGMNVVWSDNDLEAYLGLAASVSKDHPVVISKFIQDAKEIEMDAVAMDGRLIMHAVSEHVENAGVHSGDATLIFPAQNLEDVTVRKIEDVTARIASALNITGPMNIQFIAKDNMIKVIECNVRASRSFPFVSKTFPSHINMIDMATRAMMGADVEPYPLSSADIPYVGVKVPQFSFTRLLGADPTLGVEMASTGEVACFGADKWEAYLKGMVATSFKIPQKGVLFSIGSYKEKNEMLPACRGLYDLGYKLFGTPGTADFLNTHGVPTTTLDWQQDNKEASLAEYSIEEQLQNNNIDLVINLPSNNKFRRPAAYTSRGYLTRRMAVDFSLPLITNVKCARMFVEALVRHGKKPLELNEYDYRTNHEMVNLPGFVNVCFKESDEDRSIGDMTKEAAAAGFTSALIAHPSLSIANTGDDFFGHLQNARSQAVVDFGLYVSSSSVCDAQTLGDVGSNAAGLFIENSKISRSKLMDLVLSWPRNMPIVINAENDNLSTVLYLAALNDRSVHVHNVTDADDFKLIGLSKASSAKVTCDVCVDRLTENSKALAIVGNNIQLIDCFAPGTSLPLDCVMSRMMSFVQKGIFTMAQIVERFCENPRRIFGLHEQSETHVEFDLEEIWSREDSGEQVTGTIRRVKLHGQTAVLDGRMFAVLGTGKDVRAVAAGMAASSPSLKARKGKEARKPEPPGLALDGSAKVPSVPRRKVTRTDADEDHPVEKRPLSEARPEIDRKLVMPAGVGGSGLNGQHILSVKQFTKPELKYIFLVAQEMRKMVKRFGTIDLLKGKVLANLFYEPSTRTSSSFMAAMHRLGGTVLPIHEVASTSVAKGESLTDTIRCMECYTDVIVLRHPDAGSSDVAASVATKPIINGGDGIGEHPTQALLDAYTIWEELGTLNNITVSLVGDLKHGRTVHSLARLLSHYRIDFNFISPPSLGMPQDVIDDVLANGATVNNTHDMKSVLPQTDVLYVTRTQKERFASVEEFEKAKSTYTITPESLHKAKSNMIIMHPLPRNDEISPDIDNHSHAVYFLQMEYGMYVRMALLAMVCGKA